MTNLEAKKMDLELQQLFIKQNGSVSSTSDPHHLKISTYNPKEKEFYFLDVFATDHQFKVRIDILEKALPIKIYVYSKFMKD